MSVRRFLQRGSAALVAAAMFAAFAPAGAHAVPAVHVIVAFDESRGQNPEGLAIDRAGNTFVSVSPLGDLWKIPVGSSSPEPFGHVDGIVPGRDFGLLGLAVGRSGDVYACAQSADPAANGVWRFNHRTGHATRLSGTEAIGIPNGLAFDRRRNLYVADSSGAIWKIRPGRSARIWLQGRALRGNGSLGLFLGANGIAFHDHVFTVTNTERRTILEIRKVDGRAGPAHVVTTLPQGDNPDGVALAEDGSAYVALNLQNAIGRVSASGRFRTIVEGSPLDFPSSLTFGTTRGEHRTLFGVNFSIGELFGLPPGFGPALWRLRVASQGLPLP